MSENRNDYWDEVEDQLKKIEEARKQEKMLFEQEKHPSTSNKRKRKSKQKKTNTGFVEDLNKNKDHVMKEEQETIPAAMTLEKNEVTDIEIDRDIKEKQFKANHEGGAEFKEKDHQNYDELDQQIEEIFKIGLEEKVEKAESESLRLDAAIDAFFIKMKGVGKTSIRVFKTMQKAVSKILEHQKQSSSRQDGSLSYEKLTAKRIILLKEYCFIAKEYLQIQSARFYDLFSEREVKVADKAAKLVNRVDYSADQWSIKMEMWMYEFFHWLERVEDYAEHHKALLIKSFAGIVTGVLLVCLLIGQISAYEYSYNGKVLGIVKDQQEVYKTIDVIGTKLADSYDAQIEIDKENDISFHRVMGFGLKLDSTEDILNTLTYMKDIKVTAYGIYVGGQQKTILQNKKTASQILQQVKDYFAPPMDGVTYDKVGFAQKVEIKPVHTKLGKIQNSAEALDYMLTGAVEKQVHVVQSGETFSEIAAFYKMKQSELVASNPTVQPDKLKIGQELYLNQDCPVLTVETVETAGYNLPIPYEITYENTTTLYKGQQTVRSMGSNGQQTVVAQIVRHNGKEVSRTVLSSEVLSQPVNQVVLVGTKATPKLIGTGTYRYPVRGARLTSKFGRRWGRTHYGIDLACSTGTRITAADGGTVKFAGYKGSYGYLVIISHGGGRETYYAHCSKLFVKKGDKVYQGQHIANVGNTGRSTGPHVHFEVHVNGTPKNPLNYLK
ncbi:peptidoglycan DD-metalloendopeptidase family protein [Anaerovorax sp. IOR16]|uniref:peptidoglycan DD-metalloendopeptidase family protein n=1 Tax=Anaerovorax sp. IOR16 TaxID=2773458 RepID=UPI0019CF84D9|nr:peptidoglycan DD-metalloendopeptidase family protein [Anaerovorax sp. IOR16]